MTDLDFSNYCLSFLKDQHLGALPFYKDEGRIFSYEDLIHGALNKARELKNADDQFFALKMKSSYSLFVHLLAANFIQKNVLILSGKEPATAIAAYQKNIPFTKIISDELIDNTYKNETIKIESDLNRPAFYILSSGTSGPSKSIPLTLNNVFHSANSVIDFFSMTNLDVTFLNLPHHHIGGLMILWRAFFSQSSITTLENDNYQFISLVPLQLKRFLDISTKREKLKQCRGVLIGGAPLIENLKTKALNLKIPLFETYGMSETCSLVLLNGKALKGQEVKLSESGQFLIKGPTLSPTLPLDREGFFHTKDVGIKNSDGSLSFQFRSDLLFKSAGEMIDPVLIEAKIKELPWIEEALIVPIKHPEWTLASSLVYKTLDTTKGAEDIRAFLKKEVHPHLVPRYFFTHVNDLINTGLKPKRYAVAEWAQSEYFKKYFHYLHLPKEKSKILVVFLVRLIEDHTDMVPLMDDHQDVSYLFIDLPGHGKTSIHNFKNRQEALSILTLLINFFKKNQEVIFYGYSMGGRIAIELALDYQTPSLLIVESAHFGLSSNNEKSKRFDSDKKIFPNEDFDSKDFFNKWYQNPIFGNYQKSASYNEEIEKKMGHSPREWQASLDFFSPGASPYILQEILSKLKTQKIVGIYGSDDHKYRDHFHSIKDLLSHFNIFEIADAGHNPHKTHLIELKKILAKALL